MKIRPISDIHLEGNFLKLKPAGEDLLVLAGDIHVHTKGVKWAKTVAAELGVPVLILAGNHEFYHHSWEDTIDDLRDAADHTDKVVKGEVTFLENATVTYDGVRFIGATLWTDMKLYGEDYLVALAVENALNDYRVIYTKTGDPIRVQDVMFRHAESLAYIREALAQPFDGMTVVVTHHAPSWLSVAEQFRADWVSAGFASRLEELILDIEPVLWLHGHMHSSFDYEIGKTRVLCNPGGYRNFRENPNFNPDLVVEI